jgi:NADH-quinone oxidoreductase subunit M
MSQFLASISYGQWILHALILLPLVGIVPVLLGSEAAAKRTALVVTTLEFLLSVGLWWALDPAAGRFQLESAAPWIPSWGISYRVGIDGISLVMVLLTTALMPLSVLGSWRYITRRERGFYALMLTLLTGMVGVFLALDLFLFYVFFDVMLIPMYFIIGIWGGTNRLYAAIKFFIYTMGGSLLMLVGILVMVWKVQAATGTLSFSYEHLLKNAGLLGPLAPWLFGAFAIA